MERRDLELKEAYTPSFLKTVSAFANYGTGRIVFGVRDDGEVCGLACAAKTRLSIENAINDAVIPTPRYTLEEAERSGRTVVVLEVLEGADKPYRYRGRAYKRSDTSTVEVDRLELNRLVLEGQNLSFEEVPSKRQDLSFKTLEARLQDALGIQGLSVDLFKTLELYSDEGGFNNAAAVLADDSPFPGMDIVRFGETMNELFDRRVVEGVSALDQYDAAIGMFRIYYQLERIEGARRSAESLIPEEAYREAVANALVHRTWDAPASTRIAMFPDRIEVTSSGGLPAGISLEEYLEGRVSILRNPILGNVFFRLDLIERFGTGVRRIKEAYRTCARQPRFDVTQNAIMVTLPLTNAPIELTIDERAVLEAMRPDTLMSRRQISDAVSFSPDKTARMLRALKAKGLIVTRGGGRSTRYLRS